MMERHIWSQAVLVHIFVKLKRHGLELGLDELLAAFRAVDRDWGATPGDLREMMTLLWCHGARDEQILTSVLAGLAPLDVEDVRRDPEQARDGRLAPPAESLRFRDMRIELEGEAALWDEWGPIPVQAPPLDGMEQLNPFEWPIPRRFMAYTWRRLYRPTASLGEDEVDIAATVERVARWGFFLEPVYRQGQSYRTHLLLLIDQNGSMMPFHRFTRELLETAQQELGSDHVEVSYFHNVPTTQVYSDSHLSKPRALDSMLEICSRRTAMVIVSDAGAARRTYSTARIDATRRFLGQARQHTHLVSWLNPMPEDRWPATSAHMIARDIAMFPMEPQGFSGLIDVARGQLSPYLA